MSRSRTLLAIGAAVVLPLALAACGSSGGTGANGAGSTTPSKVTSSVGAGSTAAASSITQALAADYQGTFRSLPTASPKPASGKSIWIITLTSQAPAVASLASAVKTADDLLGWKTTTFDGQSSPTRWNDGIRQAIAAKANGIVLALVECAPVQTTLKQAKAAGIKIFGGVGDDCGSSGAGSNLFDASTYQTYPGGQSGLYEHIANARAEWIAAKAGAGGAGVLEFVEPDYAALAQPTKDFAAALAKDCPTCHLDTASFSLTDLGTQLRAKVDAALLKYPKDTFVAFPYDSAILLGGSAGIEASPRRADLQVVGGECLTPNLALIRANAGESSCVGVPYPWIGWAAVDSLNRLFQGTAQVDEGIGVQLVDADHGLPAKGAAFDGPAGYQANFKKIWSVG